MCPSKRKPQSSSSSSSTNKDKQKKTSSMIQTTLNNFLIREHGGGGGRNNHNSHSIEQDLNVSSSSTASSHPPSTNSSNQPSTNTTTSLDQNHSLLSPNTTTTTPKNCNILVNASTFQAQFQGGNPLMDSNTLSESDEEHSSQTMTTLFTTPKDVRASSNTSSKRKPPIRTPQAAKVLSHDKSYTPYKYQSSRLVNAPEIPQYQQLPKIPPGVGSFTPPKNFGPEKAEKYELYFQWLLNEIYHHDQFSDARKMSVDNMTAQRDVEGQAVFKSTEFQKKVYHLIKNFRQDVLRTKAKVEKENAAMRNRRLKRIEKGICVSCPNPVEDTYEIEVPLKHVQNLYEVDSTTTATTTKTVRFTQCLSCALNMPSIAAPPEKRPFKKFVVPFMASTLSVMGFVYQPVLNFLKQHPNITWEQVFEDGKIGDRNNISKFMTFNVSGGESNDDNDNNMAIGESKIGGYPDLPRDFEWPKDSHGKKWPFICQLNVQQLEYLDLTNRVIPKGGGMLYFFTPFDEASSGGSYWGVRKCDHQPMTYLNAIQIEEMGGLERRIHSIITSATTTLSFKENHDDEEDVEEFSRNSYLLPPMKMIISSFVGSSFIATKLFSGEESWPYHVHSPVDTTHEAHFIKNICGEDQHVHSSSSHHHHGEDQHEQIDYYLHVKIHGYGSLDGDLSELEQVMGLPIASIDIHRLYISTSSFYPLTEMEMALIPYNAHVLLYSSSKLEKEVQLHVGSIEQVKPLLKNKQLHVYLPYTFVSEQ